MGTDIHLFVEYREGAGAPWQLGTPEWICGDCDGFGDSPYAPDSDARCGLCGGVGRVTRWVDRNAGLFWALGGVTDDPEGPPWQPFAVNRGWPPDGVSEGVRTCVEQSEREVPDFLRIALGRRPEGGGDPATTSWATLAELGAYFAALPRAVREEIGEKVFARFLPACGALAKRPEDVRLVFNFSS